MKEQIKMIVFVIILGVAAAGVLVGSKNFTDPVIAKNQELSLKSTILDAFEIDYAGQAIEAVYEANIMSEDVDGYTFYTTADGYIGFEFEGAGLWGPIEGFLSLESDLTTIKSVGVSYNEETPGLGGIVGEKWYLDKYRGKKFEPELLVLKEADMSKVNEVDAITGATNTSIAFQVILNENYQTRKEVLAQ